MSNRGQDDRIEVFIRNYQSSALSDLWIVLL
jgi:hypothetical protein